MTTTMEPGPSCQLCEIAPRRRRELCWSCYKKLREAGIPLPEKDRRCMSNADILALLIAVLRAMTKSERRAIRVALTEQEPVT